MTPWPLVLLISNSAYRSFTLNLKPLNQIITIVKRTDGTGVQGGIFSQILADPTTTRVGAYCAHQFINCPSPRPPPPDFQTLRRT